MTTTTPEALAEEADATAAEIAAAEAEVREVEASIEDGADVEFDRVPRLEHHIRLLRTKLRGLGRRRAEAATDRRHAELVQLRAELEAEADAGAERIEKLGVVAHRALVAFIEAARAHNDQHAHRAGQLSSYGVSGFGAAAEPPPHNVGLGLDGQGAIAVGLRRLGRLDVPDELVALADGNSPLLRGIAAAISREVADVPADMRFFRNASGTVHAVGEDFIARMPSAIRDMTELSRDEWLAEQWSSAS